MEMMKVFEAPYEPTEVWNAWCNYCEDRGRRYIMVWVDDLRYDESSDILQDGPWTPIYNWLISEGAENGETVLVNYDW